MHERLTSALLARSRGRWADGAIVGALVGAAVLELVLARQPQNPLNDPQAPLVAVGFMVSCCAVVARRRHAVVAGSAIGAMILIEGIAGDAGYNLDAELLALCVLAYAMGAFAGTYAAAIGLVLLVGTLEGATLLVHGAWLPLLFVIGPWAGGRVVHARQEIVTRLEQRSLELEAEQDAYARLAVSHERARIARELHDVVSHNLAVIVVQAGAGRVAPPSAAALAANRFSNIRQAGEHGLAELSRLADILRTEASVGGTDAQSLPLNVLIEHARAAGLTVHGNAPTGDVLSREVEETTYRILQEALTNALKHAPGAELTVRMTVGDGMLELDVCDDGGHPTTWDLHISGSGIGLVGMGERVAKVGGQLHAGADPGGGWRVTARLPMAARRA